MWVEMNFRDNEQFAHTFFIIVMFADLKTYVFKQKLIITLPDTQSLQDCLELDSNHNIDEFLANPSLNMKDLGV